MAVLSICIPTYNRAEILRVSLESLVSQDVFRTSNDVEIVISDNCSSDHTAEVAKEFIGKYKNKIKYFCNETNVKDKNAMLALSRGKGEFLKICNDTLLYKPNSLSYMLQIINENKQDKPVLFFKNYKKGTNCDCKSLDEFVSKVSFMSTWLGGLGIWKDDLQYLPYMDNYIQTKLPQTAVLLKMVANKKFAKIITTQFCRLIRPSVSGDYNLSEVFIKNYLNLYSIYLENGELSRKVYEKEKWKVLQKHVLPRQYNVRHMFMYDKKDFWRYTSEYHASLKFYLLLAQCFIKKLQYSIKNIYCQNKRKSLV